MRLLAIVLSTLIAAIGSAGVHDKAPVGPMEAMNSASWWIGTYGLVDGSDPLARRAEEVFRRTAAAADKRSNRLPRLVLLRRPPRPQANALPDGSVVVTRAAVELCYRNGRDARGDAKLAFVFGHELSHLANDDFWRGPASFGVRPRDAGNGAALAGGDVAEEWQRESKADSHGIVYATLAGYDPRAVASGTFLAEWVTHRGQEEPPAAGERLAAQRVELIRAELLAVGEELDVFQFGIRLLQLGRHADALILLERFRTRFPGREVLNNVALAQLQLAMQFLASCDPALYLRFRLPLIVDPETLAASTSSIGPIPNVRAPGSPTPNCTGSARFHSHWSEAVRSFQLARERDPSYVLAYVNLATALLVAGNGTEALNEANSALKLEPGNRAASLQRAVALYLMGNENDIDTVGATVESLRELQTVDAASADVAYNLARILTERGRPAAASQAWGKFLALEPSGSYATEALRWLPDQSAAPASRPRASAGWRLPAPPLALGTNAAALRMPQLSVRDVREGSFRGSVLRAQQFRALAIDDVVELVERPTQATASPAQAYGTPQRVERGRTADLYFYPGLMVEWSPGRSRVEVFFQPTSRASGHR